jgi:transcriptional regulator with XRE-family HTH domain
MSTANDRFRETRIACNKTQEEWGNILGISRGGVTEIESGRRNVTDKHLKALEFFKEKSINVNWIRTGEGEMFLQLTRNQEIQIFANQVMSDVDESIKKRLFLALSKLNENDWKTIEKIVDELSKN